jgi:membrane protein
MLGKMFQAWSDDYVPSMGAALAYYTMFSLAPLLLIVIAIAGLVFGQDAARGEIEAQLRSLMGEGSAVAVQELLKSVRHPASGIAATVVGVVLLLVGATSVFGELQDTLNRIWKAPVRSNVGGWIKLIRSRLLSFGMVLALGFLLLVSLVVSAGLTVAGQWWGPIFGQWVVLAAIVNAMSSFLVVATMFAFIYKIMPNVHVQWSDVWVGALVTALLFSVGKYAIGLYIGHSGVVSGFGAAGSLVVVMLWVYYSAQIFLMGAEFTWIYANTFGSRSGQAQSGSTGLEGIVASETLDSLQKT